MTGPIRKAIFISAVDYESPIQVGDHQLARQLAADGWQVLFISKPITPFHLFSKEKDAIKRRFRSHRTKGHCYSIGKGEIWSFVPFALITPQNKKILAHDRVYQSWHKTLIPNMKQSLAEIGFLEVDLVYIRDPLQGYLLDMVKAKHTLFRVADNDAGFSTFNQSYARAEKELAQKVDLVIYSAMELEEYVSKLNPRQTAYLPNGVDFEHFQGEKKLPDLYRSLNRPIVVYAGSIDFWFDFDLVNQLATDLPDYSFVIIGPNQKFASRFLKVNNLILTGAIPYQNLPSYLSFADIGIIPFNKRDFPRLVNAISPVKLLEYMACGLPVLASKWNELENTPSPAILCDSYQEFRIGIENFKDLKKQTETYVRFARENDWVKRYREILNLISFDRSV